MINGKIFCKSGRRRMLWSCWVRMSLYVVACVDTVAWFMSVLLTCSSRFTPVFTSKPRMLTKFSNPPQILAYSGGLSTPAYRKAVFCSTVVVAMLSVVGVRMQCSSSSSSGCSGIARNYFRGGANFGGLGDFRPPVGSIGEAQVDSEGKAPRSWRLRDNNVYRILTTR